MSQTYISIFVSVDNSFKTGNTSLSHFNPPNPDPIFGKYNGRFFVSSNAITLPNASVIAPKSA